MTPVKLRKLTQEGKSTQSGADNKKVAFRHTEEKV